MLCKRSARLLARSVTTVASVSSVAVVAASLLGMVMSGCTGSAAAVPDGVAGIGTIAPAGYDRAFDAAREVLRDNQFLLERVDALAGVITTQRSSVPRSAWDGVQRRQRYAVVRFVPSAGGAGATGVTGAADGAAAADVRTSGVPLVATVRVIVERIEVPGWRIPREGVNLTTHTSDPAKVSADLEPLYSVQVGEDPELAAYLAGKIKAKLSETPKKK